MGIEGLVFECCMFKICFSHEMNMHEPPKVGGGGLNGSKKGELKQGQTIVKILG